MDSWNSACVPTTSLMSPFATASSALRRVRAGNEPVISATGMSERREPALEILRVLLGQQLRRRHERGLQPAADGARGGRGGHHGLAAAHVALHQPHHGPVVGEIAIDFRSARVCAPVSLNGSEARKRCSSPLASSRRQAGSLWISWRSSRSDSWCASSSSKASRRCAG